MKYVAKDNNLSMDHDIKYLQEIAPSDFSDYLRNNSNRTELGVLFCNSEWPIADGISIPCQFSRTINKKLIFYSIIYNATEIFSTIYTKNSQGAQPTHPAASSLKVSLDSALFAYFAEDKTGTGNLDLDLDPEDTSLPKIRNLVKQEFPRSFSRFFIGIDIVTASGALQFFVPFMVCIN